VALVREAGQVEIGLRLQVGAGEASFRCRIQHRQPPAAQEIVHERGGEDRLAGTRKAGHPEPHGGGDQAAGEVAEPAGGDPCLFCNV